jgi:glutamate dehydrogenase/leucine dehydrogenase
MSTIVHEPMATTRQNPGRVRARCVAEAGNGPTTADAEAILR